MMTDYKTMTLDLPEEQASEDFAACLAQCLNPPLVMTFSGDLGSGKTTFIRAMLRQLGIQSSIKSPTFSLVESYESASLLIHHFDLYRIHQEEELDYLGFRDFFTKDSICCIEWPEHAANALPKIDIRFKLRMKGAGRELHISALSAAGKQILARLTGDS
jgi:tRNA threonylcarbamoyladenosine biosynthesis protein TsaE